MKIGLLITSIGNFGQKGFYNAQEIGLAKALDQLVDQVILYKLVPADQSPQKETIEGTRSATLYTIPARKIGNSGFFNVNILDDTLDALVYFSDTQLMVPRVAKWAKKHRVPLYPYLGVLESHSTNTLARIVMNILFKRDIAVYTRHHCFAKTPQVKRQLEQLGVKQVTVTPVGLDVTLLRNDYENYPQEVLKEKYGYEEQHRVLLFIGRMVPEKQPEQMIDIFRMLHEQDDNYRLLMVGTGPLRSRVEERAKALGLEAQVKLIDRIPNCDIWELYRLADTFVNLNQQEIFGMAILEAMYYGCKVIAWHAPGPDFIIEDGVSGGLVSGEEEVVCKISAEIDPVKAHARIEERFTWDSTAEIIMKVLNYNNIKPNGMFYS